jgi:AraC-like DNA-binding protein
MTKDAYDCHYCVFKHPPIEATSYCIIGPWLEEKSDKEGIDAILRHYDIPYHLRPELEHYLDTVPYITMPLSWKGTLYTVISCLCGKTSSINISYNAIDINPAGEYSPEPEAVLSMKKIEEIHHLEEAMLDAVNKGSAKRAYQYLSRLQNHQKEKGTQLTFRDQKNYTIALNTLFRKTVERGYVHPVHINAVSSNFINHIESASGIVELAHICENMIHRYCKLVREFSLKDYSPTVRNVINFVDLNLRDFLSLNTLAGQFSVNPSYLSTLFKKEKGITLTDYITTKRMEHAVSLLRGTHLHIQNVAEQCGFLDTNYFSRLFKRHYGQSPQHFRKQFNNQH